MITKQDFLELAHSIKKDLEQRFKANELKKDYIYQTLFRLIDEVENEKFSSPETDIGTAAVKLFDSGEPEDKTLSHKICKLDDMYRRIQINLRLS